MFDVILKADKGKKSERIRCNINHCTIGKSRENLVQIRGWRVANVHAELEQTDKGIFIIDKSDGAGLTVNGGRATHYGPLRSSDQIEIGSYIIKVGVSEVEVEAEAEADAADKETQGFAGEREGVDMSRLRETQSMLLKTMVGIRPHIQGKSDEAIRKEKRYMWRNRVHQEILRQMDLRRTDVGSMTEEELRVSIELLINDVVGGMEAQLPHDIDRQKLKKEVLDEAVGLGPLEDLLADSDITEVMVNRYDDIYIERKGKLQKTDVTFSSDDAVMSAIERIVSPLGRRIDESSPMVDARLKDGSRVNAIIPPLALKGPCITIRKFSDKKLTDEDLVRFGSANPAIVSLLRTAVEQRCNVISSGGTGSGKTTLLNILSNFIPPDERVITVEDAAELKLSQPHVVSLEARPPNLEGKGAVPIRDLVKNCLRMRPDRIVVGECRGGEALDMLQAMNTGHDGSLTTAHANTPRDCISRLEVMVLMAGMDLPVRAIREQVASAVDIIVQQTRFSDGSRRITHVSEITGVEGGTGTVQMNDIFLYKQQGFDSDGKVKGDFTATGQVPQFYQELRERGINVDMSIFGN
jgi:pilus assembly protein CpaF